MEDAPRLLIEVIRWACSKDATCLNYMEAIDLTVSRGQVTGVRAFDHVAGMEWEFRAPMVVNCTGPWIGAVAQLFDLEVPPLIQPSLAFNILVDLEPISSLAVAVSPPTRGSSMTPDGDPVTSPTYFLRPWRGGMLVGTRHLPREGIEEPEPTHDELRSFLADLNHALPRLELQASDVVRVYSGILPAKRAGSTQLATRDVIYVHSTTGGPTGLVSVLGVKYTTARSVAERTLRVLFGRRLKPAPPA
jgi:glycerol-3-phosphate dehydrogenase